MLIIENISGVVVDINDLGLTLDIGESTDLSIEGEAQAVAASGMTGGDLNSLISSNNIVVKDPRNLTSNLNTAQAIAAVRSHNNTHYRLPLGSRISDADDVDLTGTGTFLKYTGTDFIRQTPAQVASDIESSIDFDNITNSHNPYEIVDRDGNTTVTVDGGGPTETNIIEAKINAVVKMQIFSTLFNIIDDVALDSYPSTRNNGPTSKALYTSGTSGQLRYGNIRVNHDTILNSDVGDPHTQYVKKAGDDVTGGIVMKTGSFIEFESGSGDLVMEGTSEIIINGSGGVNLQGTGVVESSFGTVTVPSYSFDGDENTGIYRPANNSLGITAGGTQGALFEFNKTTLNHEITLSAYPNVRDDGPTTKALYVDGGVIKYGDVETSDVGGVSQQLSSWTLLTDNLYYSDFVHNLGTTNVAIYIRETSNNRLVYPEYTEIVDLNTVRTVVEGNAEALTINVVSGAGPRGAPGADGILNVVEDTTPQLGGNLDMNGNSIQAGAVDISPTELSSLNGVSSNIQSQLDTKTTATGHTHTFRLPHTWGISGPINVASGQDGFLLPMFISLAPNQTASVAACRHRLNSGTSAVVSLQRNGVNVAGFTNITVTGTATTTNPANVSLSTDDALALIVNSATGSPENMSFTLFIEYTQ